MTGSLGGLPVQILSYRAFTRSARTQHPGSSFPTLAAIAASAGMAQITVHRSARGIARY